MYAFSYGFTAAGGFAVSIDVNRTRNVIHTHADFPAECHPNVL